MHACMTWPHLRREKCRYLLSICNTNLDHLTPYTIHNLSYHTIHTLCSSAFLHHFSSPVLRPLRTEKHGINWAMSPKWNQPLLVCLSCPFWTSPIKQVSGYNLLHHCKRKRWPLPTPRPQRPPRPFHRSHSTPYNPTFHPPNPHYSTHTKSNRCSLRPTTIIFSLR